MAAGGHFDLRKSLSVAFLAISDQYETFCLIFLWLPSAILDVRNSLWITFLAILDKYRFFFDNMANVGHFGYRYFNFDRISVISDRYATLIIFAIFNKMPDVGHFGCPKFTFDRISGHFRSIRNFIFFGKFVTKWLPSAILDVPKFTFDRISGHFRSIGHFGCLKLIHFR